MPFVSSERSRRGRRKPIGESAKSRSSLPGENLPDPEVFMPVLIQDLRGRGVKRLYSDRWVANQIHEACAGDIDVMLSPVAFSGSPLPWGERVTFSRDTALLCLLHDVETTKRALRRFGFQVRETEIGPWMLLEYGGRRILEGQWPAPAPPLLWSGFGCLRGHNADYAQDLYEQGVMLMDESRDVAEGQRMLMAAVAAHPNIVTVDPALFDSIFGGGPALAENRANTQFSGSQAIVDAHYSGGILLENVILPTESVRPGGTFKISYSWRRHAVVPRERLQVFVHFRQDGIRFQDDHRFLSALPVHTLKVHRFPELDTEHRLVQVPEDAPTGSYDVHVGLFNWKTSGRLKVSCELPIRHRAVILKNAVRIEG